MTGSIRNFENLNFTPKSSVFCFSQGQTSEYDRLAQLSNSREFGGVLGALTTLPEGRQDRSPSGFENSEGSREKSETTFLTTFSFRICPEFN